MSYGRESDKATSGRTKGSVSILTSLETDSTKVTLKVEKKEHGSSDSKITSKPYFMKMLNTNVAVNVVIAVSALSVAGITVAKHWPPTKPTTNSTSSGTQASVDYINAVRQDVTLYQNHQFEAALPYFDKAIGLDATRPDAYANKALTYNSLLQYDNVIVCCDEAIKNVDEHLDMAPIYQAKARAENMKGNISGAVRDLKECVKALHRVPSPYVEAGEAETELNALLAIQPQLHTP